MLAFSTWKKKAREAGYSLQRGYQRYLHKGWGYVKDPDGNRRIGYQVMDTKTGLLLSLSYTDLFDHALSEKEAIALLRELIA